ncbi:MAG: methylmalonyl-CoA epimerase [Clostridiaceae bacterium]|jgi:methylmalonyl-CoA/ethylmalonyl-CoA epimerase|nr:methylmalonyl-CoA epimerase [Clostridiaceae bacterium]
MKGGIQLVRKLDHIGIAVSNLDEAVKLYKDVLGLELHGTEVVPEQKVKVAFLPVGDTEVELLESTSAEGPIAKFIEAKGQGIQHIAFRVDDIEAALEEMKAKGMRLIDEKPRYGAGGAKIAFLHPKSTNGVLIELCERKQ